jgi:hypothetical protein
VQSVFIEAAVGRRAGVRSMLSRDALRFLPYRRPPGASEPILWAPNKRLNPTMLTMGATLSVLSVLCKAG